MIPVVPFDQFRTTEVVVTLPVVRPEGATKSVETAELVVVGTDDKLPLTVYTRKK